jgi:hypothetical protein
MIKQGILKPGSPSAASSKPSQFVKNGEALRDGEDAPKGPETLVGKIPLEAE